MSPTITMSERERGKRCESLRRQNERIRAKINYLEEEIIKRPAEVSLKIQLDEARGELEQKEQELEELA